MNRKKSKGIYVIICIGIIAAIGIGVQILGGKTSTAEIKQSKADYTDDGIVNINFTNSSGSDTELAEPSSLLGDYVYPDNPAEALRSYLVIDAGERALPMEINDVQTIEFEGKECSQFRITFTNGSENMCVITFTDKYLFSSRENSLDGRSNPSFTIAFKDPDNSQDMIIVLTSVIRYLSPDLSFEEAERLAKAQDDTISTDGYAMPQDIGAYQVQARYTNPHIFVSIPDFDAMYGVKVTALKQMWRGALDTRYFHELKTNEDYNLITEVYPYWEETKEPECIYADFIVKNVWQRQSHLHGETWVIVDLVSMTGLQFSLSLDTWEYPDTYEFGVGQQYTIYIQRYPRSGIVYAVQKSESTQLNSRGEVQLIDYPTDNFEDRRWRVEPEGEGEVYDVCFTLQSQGYGERFAALEGHGIGEKQWPSDPAREGYTFIGWYDNLDWEGNPYTKDTPVYQDTYLYARWKYTGSGGIRPRAYRGDIQGVDEGSSYTIGQELSITASGYNRNLETPNDQRFRWIPVTWRLSDGTNGSFSGEDTYQATLSFDNKGEQYLYITYLEEIFDGIDWQETGQLYEVEEVLFRID